MTNEEFKRTLWEAADKLRGSVAAATYKYPVLGLVFLKYVSDMFDAQGRVIGKKLAEPTSEYYMEATGSAGFMRATASRSRGSRATSDQRSRAWSSPPGATVSPSTTCQPTLANQSRQASSRWFSFIPCAAPVSPWGSMPLNASRRLAPPRPRRHKKARINGGLCRSTRCFYRETWWLRVDSNHRPQHYECCALTG